MSFDSLGLAKPILRAVSEEGYVNTTPIQAAAIPVILSGRDLVGIAQTGTGKTAAFALPILDRLSRLASARQAKRCRVLVLTPTRELAAQVAASFRTYGRHLDVSVALAIGGVAVSPQVRALRTGVDVLVATPGRLLDLSRSGALDLRAVTQVVLDEADRMLDMGFIHDIRKILALLPRPRQTILFSATMPTEIRHLAREMLSDPVTVGVSAPASTVPGVSQQAVHVSGPGAKLSVLAHLLRTTPIDRAIVFARTKRGADRIVRNLATAGISAQALHGDKSQGQRERTLAAFRSGHVRTLIATDIAARGIDVDGVSHVVNYDVPNIPESYVHRIGRTARAGNTGVAISLCAPDELPFLKAIEKLTRQIIPAHTADAIVDPQLAELSAAKPARTRRRHQRRSDDRSRPNRRETHGRGNRSYAVAAGD